MENNKNEGGGCLPLKWPRNLERQSHSEIKRFFAEIPIIGINARLRRHVRKQILKREGSIDISDYWSRSHCRQKIAEEMSRLIADHCGWPSHKFIPEDPCEILLFYGADGLQPVSAILDIQQRFRLPNDIINNIYSFTLGELVEEIMKDKAGEMK